MKKLNYIIIVIIGLLALYSCEDAIDSAYKGSTKSGLSVFSKADLVLTALKISRY